MTSPASSIKRDMAALAPTLELRDPGIWFARAQSPVSYPAQGNADCLKVEENSFWFRPSQPLHRERGAAFFPRRNLL